MKSKKGTVVRVVMSVWAVMLTLSMAACGNGQETAEADGAVELHKNIVYSTRGEEELTLDMAIPSKGEGPFPVLIFIHKGAWDVASCGIKEEHRADILLAAQRAYIGASINYRTLEENPSGEGYINAFPAQFHDCQDAVRWLRRHAEKYGIDPDHFGTYGPGSGGQLALLLGYVDPGEGIEDGGEQGISSKVQAVVTAEGVFDIPAILELGEEYPMKVSMRYREYAENHVGGKHFASEDLFRKASPVTYIDEGDAPTLTLQGKLATWAPVEITESFDKQMRRVGVHHTLVMRPDLGNRIDILWNREDDFPVWDFFDTYLRVR